jgi:predicted porin
VRADTYWGGVTHQAGHHADRRGLPRQRQERRRRPGCRSALYVARILYALSKRTDLYTAVAYTKAKNGKLTGLSRDDAGFATPQTGVTVGIQHRF